MPDAHPNPPMHHGCRLPLRMGTRGPTLARRQTRLFLELLTRLAGIRRLGLVDVPMPVLPPAVMVTGAELGAAFRADSPSDILG